MINRRPAPRSRELLCTDGVVERVAAHHAHALGRQRHAGTEQSLHLCGCCRGASTLRDDDGGFGHGCETTSSAHALGFEKVAVVGLSHRYAQGSSPIFLPLPWVGDHDRRGSNDWRRDDSRDCPAKCPHRGRLARTSGGQSCAARSSSFNTYGAAHSRRYHHPSSRWHATHCNSE